MNTPHRHSTLWGRVCIWLIAMCCVPGILPRSIHAEGGEQLWAVLIVASIEEQRGEVPEKLKEFSEQMDEIFGYNTYKILEEKNKPLDLLDSPIEVTSQPFSMVLNYKGMQDKCHQFAFQLFQKQEEIVKSDIAVAPGSPWYIRGPTWGSSELIILILTRPM